MEDPVLGIRVGVVHGPGEQLRPVWFDLNRRKHSIREITNSWRERRGESLLWHFHVVDEGALYELVYNLADSSWQLQLIEAL